MGRTENITLSVDPIALGISIVTGVFLNLVAVLVIMEAYTDYGPWVSWFIQVHGISSVEFVYIVTLLPVIACVYRKMMSTD